MLYRKIPKKRPGTKQIAWAPVELPFYFKYIVKDHQISVFDLQEGMQTESMK